MPPKKRPTKSKSKIVGRGTRRGFRYPTMAMPRARTGITIGSMRKPSEFVTLKYSDTYDLTTASTNSAEQTMLINSLYDPDYTGSGHQPYGHDTLATMWTRYRVHGVKYQLSFSPEAADLPNGQVYIRDVGASASAPTPSTNMDPAFLIESGQAFRHKEIPYMATAGGPQKPLKLNGYINFKKFSNSFNIKDKDFSAAFGSSPTVPIYMVFGWTSKDSTAITVNVTATFTFYCSVSEPKVLTQS